jgi:hypothetical protein
MAAPDNGRFRMGVEHRLGERPIGILNIGWPLSQYK